MRYSSLKAAIWLRRKVGVVGRHFRRKSNVRPLLSVFSTIFFAVFSQISFGQDSFTVTELQSQFAQSVKNSLSDVVDAEWESPIDLWVYADGVDKKTARNIALDVIYVGETQLGQSFCVHVHNGDFNQIAMLCWSY